MAIADLFWACPLCGAPRAIQPHEGGERCSACGAGYRRGQGADILAEEADGARHVDSAAAWLDRLPPLRLSLPVQAIVAVGFGLPPTPVRRGRELLGWLERFGDPVPGTLLLTHDRLRFQPDHGQPHTWPLEEVTGFQPGGGVLQLKLRGRLPLAVGFPEDSVRHWELFLSDALSGHWDACGRGAIREFQPRLVGTP